MFFIILFGIKELYKLWKKTFKTIHQLSYFVGHPVDPKTVDKKDDISAISYNLMLYKVNSLKVACKSIY